MRKGNIEELFGNAFSVSNIETIKPIMSIEEQIEKSMISAGITPPKDIIFDGKIHRFSNDKKNGKTGWYIFFPDGIPAGRFGCWRSGIEVTWKAEVGRRLTVAEEIVHARRISEARSIRDAELEKLQTVSISVVEKIWSDCGKASEDHPYLRRKGILPHGARVTGDGRLVVPLFDAQGNLGSLQYIDAEGGKLYHAGAQVSGKFFIIGTADIPGTIYLAEGFATAATIHEAMDRPCVAAYSASNIVPVLGELRSRFGTLQDIVIVADNDASGVGQKYAEQAAAKYGARVIISPEMGDANDYRQSGNDLVALLTPQNDGWLVSVDEFCQQPAPISWLIKRWLQSQALVMVHGPSGGGKTFVVLDWCLRLASNVSEWAGYRVKPASVVYLAGEGHHGLRSRVAAWKQAQSGGPANMWLSRQGCDLNTAEGYNRVVDSVRSLSRRPDLIVVDTLHRFLLGDENSAQDAKTMLDACGGLMAEFGCSVLLVHHTGVSEEAQHRARGSSAWRGALDIEISIVPAKDGAPMEIVQRKSKDAELVNPVYAELRSVEIPGWLDEDGEQVTSAVVEIVEAPVKREIKDSLPRKRFEGAWWESGAELLDGAPYVTRASLRRHLIEQAALSEASADKAMQPTYPKGVIGPLVNDKIIAPAGHGWVVCDHTHASALIMAKNGLG